MELQAQVLLQEETTKARASIDRLRRLFSALERTMAPVTVAIVSESLYIDQDPSMLSGLADAAARARATVHVVRPLGDGVSMVDSTFSQASDDALREAGLDALSSALRGRLVRVSGTGDSAFSALAREMSGYYLLGLEPAPDDRAGRTRRLRVRVARRHVEVRARSMFAPASVDVSTGPEDRLRETLRAVLPVRDLPVTVSTRTVPIAFSSQVRVQVAGEVGRPESPPASAHVGYVVLTAAGTVVSSSAARISVTTARAAGAAPTVFTTALDLDAGDYELRFGAIDGDGRAGSVHHVVRARADHSDPQLTPTALRDAIDDLRRVAPVSPALGPFVDAARAGRFGSPPEADARPRGDVAMVTFVAGLAALRDGRLSAARALFAQTRRAAPGFGSLDGFVTLTTPR